MRGEKVQFGFIDKSVKALEGLRKDWNVTDYWKECEECRKSFIDAIQNNYGDIQKTRSETLKFKNELVKVDKIKSYKEFQKFLAAVNKFKNILEKQTGTVKKFFGHTSLFATPENKESIQKLFDELTKFETIYSERLNEAKIGLVNVGESCYLNSAIQQLYQISGFRKSVLNTDENTLNFIKENSSDKEIETKINKLIAVKKLFVYLQTRKNTKGKVLKGSDLTNYIQSCMMALGHTGMQEDSISSFKGVMKDCESIIKQLEINKSISKEAEDFEKTYIKKAKESCRVRAVTFTNNLIENIIYTRKHKFDKLSENALTDDEKKKVVLCSKKFVINILRQSGLGSAIQGIEKTFDGSSVESVITFMDGTKELKNPQFELTGVTMYKGDGISGHYYVYLKIDNQWYMKSDSMVLMSDWNNMKNDGLSNYAVSLVYELK